MGALRRAFDQVPRPPGQRKAPQFKPTGGQDFETSGDFAQGGRGKFVVRSNESPRRAKARLLQLSAPMLQTACDCGRLASAGAAAIKLKIVVIAAVLDDAVLRIGFEVLDKFEVCSDGKRLTGRSFRTGINSIQK